MSISLLRHPFRAGQMAIERSSCTSGFTFRINMEHKPRHRAPIGHLRIGIKQAAEGDDVFLVVCGQGRIGRRHIGDVGSSGGFFVILGRCELF
jgi:hypothetical protein